MAFSHSSTQVRNKFQAISKKKFLAFTLIVAAVLGIFTYVSWKQQINLQQLPFINTTLLSSLPTKDASSIDTSHLADGLAPPTNKWFSGLVLQKIPKTTFPTPLSFTPTESTFSINLPDVTATGNTITNASLEPTTISVAGATHYVTTRYDELSIDLTYRDDHQALGVVTLTAGSPYVYFHALVKTSLTVRSETGTTNISGTVGSIKADKTKLTVAGFNGTKLSHATAQITTSLPAEGLATFYILPSSAEDHLLEAANNRLTSTQVSYKKTDAAYQTSIKLVTDNGQPTYLGLLPHQATSDKEVFHYDTLYGKQRLMKTSDQSFTTPLVPVADSLDLSSVNEADKELLRTTLRHDINATKLLAEDTYFSGKELYRSAQLLTLAKQLHEESIASSIQKKLHQELSTWLDPTSPRSKKYFYYDTKIHGLVGETIAFGSEDFNDHHFHYGYFIYAASTLAKYDSDFLTQYGPMVDLLVADIANYRSDEPLPLRRLFDPYFGHSWASGSAPFNDGNNQESSSEAINAWIGTTLWAQQTKNTELQLQSEWMLSNEVESTEKYWLNFNENGTPYSNGYNRSLVSLNWGGKRDYATFFSAAPSAMLGILLIPMSPTTIYQSSLGNRIDQHVDEAITNNDYQVQFGDYILMYKSLRDKTGLLDKAKALPDESIDNANSRSYLYAWIMSRR